MKKNTRIRFVLGVSLACLVLSLLSCIFAQDADARRRIRKLPSRLVLYGVANFEYVRHWYSGGDASDSFIQDHTIGITGPIIDPRLASFNLSGRFQDTSGIQGTDLFGLDMRLDLLNDLSGLRNPKYRFLLYLPRPTTLWYSRHWNEVDTTYYGLSTVYYLPAYLKLLSEGKTIGLGSIAEYQRKYYYNRNNNNNNNNNNGTVSRFSGLNIPLPLLILNYDRSISEGNGFERDRTLFDISAKSAHSGRTAYILTYRRESTDTEDNDRKYSFTTDTVELETQHEIRLFHVYNTFRYVNRDESPSEYRIRSRAFREFRRGPYTTYSLTFGPRYFKKGDASTFSFFATGTMRRRITPVLSSTTSLTGDISTSSGNGNDYDDSSSLNLLQSVEYSGLRGLLLSGTVTTGITEDGVPFSLDAYVTTTRWRRIIFTGRYRYSRNPRETDDDDFVTQSHIITFGATGYISSNLIAEAQYQHSIDDVDNGDFSERTFDRLDARLLWRYYRHRLSAGSFFQKLDNAVSSRIYGFDVNYNTYFFRRINFRLGLSYQEEMDNNNTYARLEADLAWKYGRTIFTAEYDVERREQEDSDTTEHRLYLRLSRYFARVLR